MNSAYVRNVATNEYIWGDPVPFQRIPSVNEYLWLNKDVYLILAVSHTWLNGQPIIILDVETAAYQQGAAPQNTGSPVFK